MFFFFFSSRRRHTRLQGDWSSDVCSSDLGETGPFLTMEQVVVARAVGAERRTWILSLYNLIGYASAALGALLVGIAVGWQALFFVFLATAVLQALAYLLLPAAIAGPARSATDRALPSGPPIRRMAALFALDSFGGGFVLQSLVAYFLHTRLDRKSVV